MVTVWRLRVNIRTAVSWIVSHNVHSQQHTCMSSSDRSNRLCLSHWDPYVVHRGSCLELYYCNMVEWFWWDSSLILTTNWFSSVLWHCWFGHLACRNGPWNDLQCVEWDVKPLHYYCLHVTVVISKSNMLAFMIACNAADAVIHSTFHSNKAKSSSVLQWLTVDEIPIKIPSLLLPLYVWLDFPRCPWSRHKDKLWTVVHAV